MGARLNRQNEQAAQGDKTPKLTRLRKGAENQTPLYLPRMSTTGELAGAQCWQAAGTQKPFARQVWPRQSPGLVVFNEMKHQCVL